MNNIATEKKMNQAPLYFLDCLRIFATLMVILLHSMTPFLFATSHYGEFSWYVLLIMNSFVRCGVPLFFMMSGFLHLSSTLSRNTYGFYKKRLLRIVVSLLIWNIIYFCYQVVTTDLPFDPAVLIGGVLEQGTFYHLWFLYSLIALYLMTPFVKKIIDTSTRAELWFFLFLVSFPSSIRPFLNMNLPLYFYLFDTLFNGYLAFYVAGYMLGTGKLTKKKGFVAYFFAILSVVHSIWGADTQSSIDAVVFPYNGGYDIHHLINATAIFIMFSLYMKAPNGNFLKKFCSLLSKITFGVYLIHALVMDILHLNYLPEYGILGSVCFLFVFTTLISFPLIFVWEKLKEFVLKNLRK